MFLNISTFKFKILYLKKIILILSAIIFKNIKCVRVLLWRGHKSKNERTFSYIFNYIQSISQIQINFIKILIFGLKVILKLKIY